MGSSYVQLVFIHIRLFFREPEVLFWVFVFPVAIAWTLGVAFTNQNQIVHTVALLPAKSGNGVIQQRLDLQYGKTEILLGSNQLATRYAFLILNEQEALTAIKKGKISLIIQDASEKENIQFRLDPQNREAQNQYLFLRHEWLGKPLQDNEMMVLTERGNRYVDYLIPGLLAMGVMNSCIWGIGWGMIELRMKKLMRRMVATPMKKTTFLLSKFSSRLLLTIFEVVTFFLFGWWYFDVYITGEISALILVFLAGTIAFAGIAVCLSSRTENTQVGNGLINAITLPMMIVSGIFFSYHSFPEEMVAIIQYLPLTLLADSIREIFLEGAGLKDVLSNIFILLGIGISFFALGLKIYKWY